MNDFLKQLDPILKPINDAMRNIAPSQLVLYTAIYALVAGLARLCVSVPAILGGAFLGGMATIGSVSAPIGSEDQAALAEAGRASGLLVITGILFLIVAPALIIIAVGLFQRMRWARMGAVFVFAISGLLSILDLLGGGGILNLIWILASLYLAYFFYTDTGIKREFGQI